MRRSVMVAVFAAVIVVCGGVTGPAPVILAGGGPPTVTLSIPYAQADFGSVTPIFAPQTIDISLAGCTITRNKKRDVTITVSPLADTATTPSGDFFPVGQIEARDATTGTYNPLALNVETPLDFIPGTSDGTFPFAFDLRLNLTGTETANEFGESYAVAIRVTAVM